METFEPQPYNNNETEGQKLQQEFDRLQKIVELLKKMELQIIERSITIDRFQNPTSEAGFPIIRDGLDGIRASYSKKSGLKILFTNGFEDHDNPKRKEIERRLRESGLM